MRQLLDGDWETHGALRPAEDLSFDEIASSSMLADARTILEYVDAEGPITLTAAAFLPRASLELLVPGLRMPTGPGSYPAEMILIPRSEGDARMLPVLRLVLMYAGLLTRSKGLRITPLGRELLPIERAGAL